MKITSSDVSSSTASALVDAVVKPKRFWALTADSDRVVATWLSWMAGFPARCGSSIEVA